MQGDLTNMTFPSGLINGDRMFSDCSGLTGGIPTLPSGLTKGDAMFAGATQLSGSCPAKPDALTSYNNMYKDTGVTCSYGK